jgi:hypothetical protein
MREHHRDAACLLFFSREAAHVQVILRLHVCLVLHTSSSSMTSVANSTSVSSIAAHSLTARGAAHTSHAFTTSTVCSTKPSIDPARETVLSVPPYTYCLCSSQSPFVSSLRLACSSCHGSVFMCTSFSRLTRASALGHSCFTFFSDENTSSCSGPF